MLAAIAAEDLEFELLTLVEGADALAGVRHAAPEDVEETGSWSLEYEGPDFHVYVRLSRVEGRHRLDGWVVPARPVTATGPAQWTHRAGARQVWQANDGT